MNKHKDFILSPIINILHEVASANYGIANGIETYPLSEHIMQSVFLRMTGFQEQKMKCICWELATNDYEYRYKRFVQKPFGECSTYDDKKTIYKDLIQFIQKYKPTFDVTAELDKTKIRKDTVKELKEIFLNSNLSTWTQCSFLDFVNDHSTLIKNTYFATEDNLLENILQDRYTLLYRHRNRCAHNTLSYQENLPTLTELFNKEYKYDNYIVRFALLILIDKIFIEIYKKYLHILEQY